MRVKIYLLLAMILILFSISACGKNNYKPNPATDFTWREYHNESEEGEGRIPEGSIIITKYVGKSKKIIVPSSIDGKLVCGIDRWAFSPYSEKEVSGNDEYYNFWHEICGLKLYDHSGNITTDKHKGKVKEADVQSFIKNSASISKIESIKIPDTVSAIGGGAFAFCGSLTSIEVYNNSSSNISNKAIECHGYTFLHCITLKEVKGNFKGDYYDSDDLYLGCTSLEEVTLYPDNENTISFDSLTLCKNLKKITITDGTTSLEGNLAMPSYGIAGVIPDSSLDGKVSLDNLKTLVIPDSVTQIDLVYNEDFAREKKSYTIITPVGSTAEKYAKQNNIPYKQKEQQ